MARTKAARLKSKRGRPRKEGEMRTESGIISRSKENVLKSATWKRRQENPGLSIEEARKPEHGSVIDAWRANGTLSRAQYDAAQSFHRLQSDWLAVIGASQPRSASDFGGPRGYDGADPFDEDRERREAAICRRFKEARRTVLESGPLGVMAIEAVVIENHNSYNLLGDLRCALNELARLWGLRIAA